MISNRRGFTLIELLVVIGILGVLAAFIFPAIRGAIVRAKVAKTKTAIVSLQTAIKSYYNDFNAYPYDVDGNNYVENDDVMRLLTGRKSTGPNRDDWEDDDDIQTNKKWNGPYLSDINESKDYKKGNNLMDNSDGFEDGYVSVSGRAAYVDGWDNGGRATYFLFVFPDPDRNPPRDKPVFYKDSFDIYSGGPDGMCKYRTLRGSDYDAGGYKNYRIQINGKWKYINENNPESWD